MKTFYYNSFVNHEFMSGTFCTEIKAKSLKHAKRIAKQQCKKHNETLIEVYEKSF